MPNELVKVERDGQFQISYHLSDGKSSAFRVEPLMAEFIMDAWRRKEIENDDQSGGAASGQCS